MKQKTTTIAPDALAVLQRSTFNGSTLDLPEQLTPKDYAAVKNAINTAGGKWVRARNTHVFPGDARAAFGAALETGKLVNEKATHQAFFTPPELAERAASLLLTLLGNPLSRASWSRVPALARWHSRPKQKAQWCHAARSSRS